MPAAHKLVERPLLVSRSADINGSVFKDAIVERNCSLHIRGNLKGSLTIEPGAHVIVEGSVDGKVVNKGGKLVINNRGIAEYARTEGPPEAEARGILRFNLNAVAANWETVQRRIDSECAATIKADAYGCGIEPIAGTLSEVGCKTFFVSDLGEAKRARAAAPKATIYVLDGIFPGTAPVFAEINARPVINSLVELAEWDVFVATSQWAGGFAVNFDTGDGRLGLAPDEAAGIAARVQCPPHGIKLVMSRLAANGGKPGQPAYDRQVALFHDLRRLFGGAVPASLAGAADAFADARTHFNMVRAGVALLGVNPTPGMPNPMQPALELHSRVVQVRKLAAGETIAYDSSWSAKRASRLAIVPVGSVDGFPRWSEGAPGPQAIVGGKPCRIAGRPSMDFLAVDVTDLTDSAAARPGEVVTLIGDELGIDVLAAATKSTGRDILCGLGRRFHRVYYAVR